MGYSTSKVDETNGGDGAARTKTVPSRRGRKASLTRPLHAPGRTQARSRALVVRPLSVVFKRFSEFGAECLPGSPTSAGWLRERMRPGALSRCWMLSMGRPSPSSSRPRRGTLRRICRPPPGLLRHTLPRSALFDAHPLFCPQGNAPRELAAHYRGCVPRSGGGLLQIRRGHALSAYTGVNSDQ